MDYQFPRQLFPSFYNSGPPTKLMERCGGNLGSYDKIIPEVLGQLLAQHAADSHGREGTTVNLLSADASVYMTAVYL